MNDQAFEGLLDRAYYGRTVEVLAAVDLDVELVNRVGQDGFTLLNRASIGGHVDLIQGLLERKADIHARNAIGWDSVISAAINGHLPALTLLMNSGARMTTTSNVTGQNALMYAAYGDNLSCAVFLLSRGCDLRLVDNQGRSALDLYDYYNHHSNEIKEQRRQILRDAFAEGPHISQVCSRLAAANQVNHSIAPSTSLTTALPTLPPPLLSTPLRRSVAETGCADCLSCTSGPAVVSSRWLHAWLWSWPRTLLYPPMRPSPTSPTRRPSSSAPCCVRVCLVTRASSSSSPRTSKSSQVPVPVPF